MAERTHRYEMTFAPRLVVKADAEGNVLCVDVFINDSLINCFDAFTGTLLNWSSDDMWEEVGQDVRANVMEYIARLALTDAE